MGKGVLTICAALVGSWAGQSFAATFQASVVYAAGGCELTDTGETGALAFCDQTFGSPLFPSYAEASTGSLRAASVSTAQRTGGQLIHNSGVARASASVWDTLFFAEDGTYSIDVDLLGEINISAPSQGWPYPTTVSLSANVNGNGRNYQFSSSGRAYYDIGQSNQVIVESPGQLSWVDTLEFEVLGGELSLSGGLFTEAACRTTGEGNCYAAALFQNSLRFTGGTFTNQSGQVDQSAFLGSSSGFDYNVGVAGHDDTTPVPLPATGLLLGLSVGLLRLSRRNQIEKTTF